MKNEKIKVVSIPCHHNKHAPYNFCSLLHKEAVGCPKGIEPFCLTPKLQALSLSKQNLDDNILI